MIEGIEETPEGIQPARGESSQLIGREEELELCVRRWQRARKGQGSVVLIAGEPGIGKTRLVAAFEEEIVAEPHTRLHYFVTPYHQTSSLYPIISQLGRAAGFERGDDMPTRRSKLDRLLAQTSTSPEDTALIGELLSLADDEHYPALTLSAQQRKGRTLAALVAQLSALARQQPVVMVFEDVHWSDPSSRELLDLTINNVKHLAVLILVTYRPEYVPHWIGQAQVSLLSLKRLSEDDGAALARNTAHAHGLSNEIIEDIVARSDGVPCSSRS